MRKNENGKYTYLRSDEWPCMKQGLADLVRELGTPNGVMVEIGSYAGESAEVFATECNWQTIHCVDPWDIYPGYERFGENFELDWAESRFDEVAARYQSVIIKQKMMSIDAALMFEDLSLDLVYIDGNHDYGHVIQDLKSWTPKVKRWIAGHDYWHESSGNFGMTPDVIKGVQDFFGRKPDRYYKDSSWAYKIR